ncbi:1513_t:CDS:2 [Funneliformis mosseae]|uniref:1513_t:CDS:1 n=1 Tax=Funneliformis mosseae TaxID=27381 RepID=A0A9N9CGC9_FUNMO|nr:1513_t:CDS:2 [Funneliformis mosseae]
MGKFTTNLTQYLPLCNLTKYGATFGNKATGFITVKNIKQNRVDLIAICTI